MKRAFIFNCLVFLGFMCVPLIAELITTTPEYVPGTGYDIMLNYPFKLGFPALALAAFFLTNLWVLSGGLAPITFAVMISAPLTVAWYVVTFFAVEQLHLSLVYSF